MLQIKQIYIILFLSFVLMPFISFSQTKYGYSRYGHSAKTVHFGSNQVDHGGFSICVGKGICPPGAAPDLTANVIYQPRQRNSEFFMQCKYSFAKDSLGFLPDVGDTTYTFLETAQIPPDWVEGTQNVIVCKNTVAVLLLPSDTLTGDMTLIIPFTIGPCLQDKQKKKKGK